MKKPIKVDKKNELGLVHVYTGESKGKTTASLGLALRAAGHGFKVCVIQFMKGGRYFGELIASENIIKNIDFAQFGKACPYSEKIKTGEAKCDGCRACFLPFEEEKEQAKKAIKYAKKIVKSNDYDLVILDEINVSVSKKQIEPNEVLELIFSKNENIELVLTGRNAHPDIISSADYVTIMEKIKHPMDSGVEARRGIEY